MRRTVESGRERERAKTKHTAVLDIKRKKSAARNSESVQLTLSKKKRRVIVATV
jgi:hypothetical protein